MHILVIGLNYKTAPVEIRERLTFNESDLVDAIKKLKQKKHPRKYHLVYM